MANADSSTPGSKGLEGGSDGRDRAKGEQAQSDRDGSAWERLASEPGNRRDDSDERTDRDERSRH